VEEPILDDARLYRIGAEDAGVKALAMISSDALPCTIGLARRGEEAVSVQIRTQALRLRPAPQFT